MAAHAVPETRRSDSAIRYCATVKLKTSLGPTVSSFGARPLKSAPGPSLARSSATIRKPCVRGRWWDRGAGERGRRAEGARGEICGRGCGHCLATSPWAGHGDG
jgi:hypothetical protein